jgi:hypothetical protein
MLVLRWWCTTLLEMSPLAGEEGDSGGTARASPWVALLWVTRIEKAVWCWKDSRSP